MTADEVRMQVCLNDVFDFQILRRRFFDVLIDVALRIDNGGFAIRADQVRRMRETSQIELLEIHWNTLEMPMDLGRADSLAIPHSGQAFARTRVRWFQILCEPLRKPRIFLCG